jgi:hypothetical protein
VAPGCDPGPRLELSLLLLTATKGGGSLPAVGVFHDVGPPSVPHDFVTQQRPTIMHGPMPMSAHTRPAYLIYMYDNMAEACGSRIYPHAEFQALTRTTTEQKGNKSVLRNDYCSLNVPSFLASRANNLRRESRPHA